MSTVPADISSTSSTPATRILGTLLRIHPDGYGFIQVAPGQPEYWVHRRQLQGEDWRAGRAVIFTPGQPKKPGAAPAALDVEPFGQSDMRRRRSSQGDAHEA